ncbi:hypothetical protein PIB30_005017 [Stylosanthes scabra]|uniref:Uncharacterized protein n=1 Tax=Stylosanthes scabra TaxID=79078 RepID=A0ABU6Y0I6_9FABA|nr:hypothetical protein [Stylosanthes scabra]
MDGRWIQVSQPFHLDQAKNYFKRNPEKRTSFKDQGCDVRSVGRSSRSMRQAVACSMWEIFCNEMNYNTWNPRGYSVCATSALSSKRQNAVIESAISE